MASDSSSSAAASVGLPPEVQTQINMSVGAVVVSNNLSFLFVGITLCGAWTYANNYRHDPWPFKALVTFCVTLCVVDCISTGSWAYSWAVTNYANPTVLAFTPWQFCLNATIVGVTTLVVQWFYAWRVWMVSMKANWYIPALIWALSCMSFGVLMWMINVVITYRLISEIERVIPVVYVWLIGSVGADVFISACMLYYLDLRYRLKSSQRQMSTQGRFRAIIVRTVECNILSLLGQLTTVVLFNQSKKVGMYFALTDMCLAKVYTISLLVSLNSRPSSGGSSSATVEVSGNSLNGPASYMLSDRRGAPANQISIAIQQETIREANQLDDSKDNISEDYKVKPDHAV
ncbi:hypothetical protein CYLTODRAFT_283633 [Cylindrobasidium torrendii FP15055 ss-10]|uniref:DUF6534 domain-containing protein n=1 Tax=Cylindrobasidium torrendii FP15055 ss-10 TaxID=1314674 RepID=A0A0D7BTF7_9AGAR|nr:hypothetical protein CYLTODRAFT_283633 [Cylindrobasidium torrendii FP15055 ss-10]